MNNKQTILKQLIKLLESINLNTFIINYFGVNQQYLKLDKVTLEFIKYQTVNNNPVTDSTVLTLNEINDKEILLNELNKIKKDAICYFITLIK